MAKLITLPTFQNEAGHLTVFEKLLPGDIKRVFYIHGAPESAERAGHAHVRSWNALVCVSGQCRVYVTNGTRETWFDLRQPDECLVLEPHDWHTMDQFAPNTVLLVASNEYYDPTDYVTERPVMTDAAILESAWVAS
jgi:hypothetical protein